METIRFKSHNSSEHQFAVTLRKRVNDYFKEKNISTKANAGMVFKSVVLLLIYILPFVALLFIPMSTIAALLMVLLMGIGIAGVGMGVMHDACHGAYSKKPWVNSMMAGTLYLLGSNVLNWKIQHNVLHHTYTNLSGLDEDINSKGPIRLSHQTSLKKFHRFQFLYAFVFYGMMTISKLVNDVSQLYNYHRLGLVTYEKKKIANEVLKIVLRKIIYLAVIIGLPLWLTDFSLLQIVIGFLLMHWVASIILSFIFQMAHVVEGASQPALSNPMETEFMVHQLNTTSDFARDNKILSWFVGGLNFQIEHHLFPNICHVHYKAIAPIVQQTALEFGFSYNLKPSFRSAMASHIQVLKELGRSA
ncbi:MAG: acyl-CoA desaturase [Bacteroidetes bacterium]|jgi:linoleoyl-CoA desaturase|nr:acyl-CoA desaturase [Bacteroidota bacterium]